MYGLLDRRAGATSPPVSDAEPTVLPGRLREHGHVTATSPMEPTMTLTFRRVRGALAGLVAEDRPSFRRIDASPARYDDGSWLQTR